MALSKFKNVFIGKYVRLRFGKSEIVFSFGALVKFAVIVNHENSP